VKSINSSGLNLVKKWEGILDGDPSTVNLDPYLDPIGIWTIGWGHAIVDPITNRHLRGLNKATRAKELYPEGISFQQAERLLEADLLDVARDVASYVRVPLNENQFAALVSFEFNLGALRKSSLLKKLNEENYDGAANEFTRWTRAGGMELLGLVSRRRDEKMLFLKEG
jgi:lysozyme